MNPILLFAFLWITVSEAAKLKTLGILHRHGARLPAEIRHGGLSWAHADLTEPGKDMLVKLAESIRERYKDFLPKSYNPNKMYSRATDYDRTRQSGTVFLNKLFPGPDDLPFETYLSDAEEFNLRFKTPSQKLHRTYSEPKVYSTLKSTILREFGQEKINAVGETLVKAGAKDANTLCADRPDLCFLLAHEYAMSNFANGEFLDPSWKESYDNFDRWVAYCYHYTEAFPGSPEYMQQIGGNGYRVMMEFIEASNKGTILHHLSGHDESLIGAYTTLGTLSYGDDRSRFNTPNFAETILLEFYDDNSVALWRSYPNQSFGSDHAYLPWMALNMLCTDTEQRTSNTINICSLEAWRRYLEAWQKPMGSGDSLCFRDATDMALSQCDQVNQRAGEPCLDFRMRCPKQACPPGSYLDVNNGYLCYRSPPASRPLPPATKLGVACAITVIVVFGTAVGILVFLKIRKASSLRWSTVGQDTVELEEE